VETTIEVTEQSQVAEVRRAATAMGLAQGLSEEDIARAALVATEASTNLVKYGKNGTVTLTRIVDEGAGGIQLVTLDRGPGFSDFHASARDGYSTGGSLGIGLGAMMRASDLFEVYTAAGQGSAFLTRIVRDRVAPPASGARLALGFRRAAMRGQIECGDAWAHASCGRWERLCIVDGLGHGPLAAIASAAAIAAFRAAGDDDTPVEIIQRCHAALAGTRGAVMAVVAIDVEARRFLFAGVGNIAGLVLGASSAHTLLSTQGIVGHRMRSLRLVEHSWSAGDAVILSSDGLSGRWNLARYPGLMHRHAMLVASVLFRDFARDTDDATVLVAKDIR
jgi:anti-sigma regulatory factor (Ser/Thr protein kinase)